MPSKGARQVDMPSPRKTPGKPKTAAQAEAEARSLTVKRVARWQEEFKSGGGRRLQGINVPSDGAAKMEKLKVAFGLTSDTQLINHLINDAFKRLKK